MTQPNVWRAARQREINELRPRTAGDILRSAIFNALGEALPVEARADDEWVLVQVRTRLGVEGDEPNEGTVVRHAFECADVTIGRYANGQVQVGSIRMGIVLVLDAAAVVHLHHGACGCQAQLVKTGEAFDPSKVPGLAELRTRVQSGTMQGDTASEEWPS